MGMSAEDIPRATPTNVGARPYNSTAIRGHWNPVPNVRDKIRGKLIGHRIKYWRQDLREVEDSQYVLSRSTKNEALIIGLQPNTYYYVRVMAYNSAGPGPESERFIERTFKMRPQKPPTAVQVHGINPSTIRVSWRYVAHRAGGAAHRVQDQSLGVRQGRAAGQRHHRLHWSLRLQAGGHHPRPQPWQDLLPQSVGV